MKMHIKIPTALRNQVSIPRKHVLLDGEVVVEFAAWLDDQLPRLEDRFSSFVIGTRQIERPVHRILSNG